jgi:hypothetical protein
MVKKFADKLKKKKPLSEENLALEMAEDAKLRSIGIDPDSNPIDIMIELDRRMEEYRKQRAIEDALEEAENNSKD